MKHPAAPLLLLTLAAAAAQAGPQRVTIRGPQNVGATVQFHIEIFNPTATPLLCRYESTFSLNRTPFPGPVGQVTVPPNSLERREASRLHENKPWAFDADVDCEEAGPRGRAPAPAVALPLPAQPPAAMPPAQLPMGPIATRPYTGPDAGPGTSAPARDALPPVAVRPAPAAPLVTPPPMPAPAPVVTPPRTVPPPVAVAPPPLPPPPPPPPPPAPAPAPQARGQRPADAVVDSLDQLKPAGAAARAPAGRDCPALDELMDHRAARHGDVRLQLGKKFECQDGRWRPSAP